MVMSPTACNPIGVVKGLKIVDDTTSPRLKARLPFAFCDHAVDDPAMGIEATIAKPTRMFCTSSGLCHNFMVSMTTAM